MPEKSYEEFEVAFTKDDITNLGKEITRQGFSGVYCPRRNEDKSCAVCKDVAKLWRLHNDTGLEVSKFSDKARRYGASAAVFMNVVFPNEPSTVKILQCGVKMASAMLNGIEYQDWGNFISPNRGMSIIVHKSKDDRGFNTYTPSIDFKTGERQLQDLTVLERLYNLDDVDDLRSGDVEIFNISSIETVIKFDVLPGWKEDGRSKFLTRVWYHYNITPEAIESGVGDDDISPQEDFEKDTDSDMGSPGVEESPFTKEETASELTTEAVDVKPETEIPVTKFTVDNPPGCFGAEYDEKDTDPDGCSSADCDLIRSACKKATAKRK